MSDDPVFNFLVLNSFLIPKIFVTLEDAFQVGPHRNCRDQVARAKLIADLFTDHVPPLDAVFLQEHFGSFQHYIDRILEKRDSSWRFLPRPLKLPLLPRPFNFINSTVDFVSMWSIATSGGCTVAASESSQARLLLVVNHPFSAVGRFEEIIGKGVTMSAFALRQPPSAVGTYGTAGLAVPYAAGSSFLAHLATNEFVSAFDPMSPTSPGNTADSRAAAAPRAAVFDRPPNGSPNAASPFPSPLPSPSRGAAQFPAPARVSDEKLQAGSPTTPAPRNAVSFESPVSLSPVPSCPSPLDVRATVVVNNPPPPSSPSPTATQAVGDLNGTPKVASGSFVRPVPSLPAPADTVPAAAGAGPSSASTSCASCGRRGARARVLVVANTHLYSGPFDISSETFHGTGVAEGEVCSVRLSQLRELVDCVSWFVEAVVSDVGTASGPVCTCEVAVVVTGDLNVPAGSAEAEFIMGTVLGGAKDLVAEGHAARVAAGVATSPFNRVASPLRSFGAPSDPTQYPSAVGGSSSLSAKRRGQRLAMVPTEAPIGVRHGGARAPFGSQLALAASTMPTASVAVVPQVVDRTVSAPARALPAGSPHMGSPPDTSPSGSSGTKGTPAVVTSPLPRGGAAVTAGCGSDPTSPIISPVLVSGADALGVPWTYDPAINRYVPPGDEGGRIDHAFLLTRIPSYAAAVASGRKMYYRPSKLAVSHVHRARIRIDKEAEAAATRARRRRLAWWWLALRGVWIGLEYLVAILLFALRQLVALLAWLVYVPVGAFRAARRIHSWLALPSTVTPGDAADAFSEVWATSRSLASAKAATAEVLVEDTPDRQVSDHWPFRIALVY